MPYCDNTHVLSFDAETAQLGKERLQHTLEDWGFNMHEDVDATTYFRTLGGVIDGAAGCVRATPERMWRLRRACEYVETHRVSSDLVQRLLGHCMSILVLNRGGMGIFRSAYDYAIKGYKSHWLWPSARREFQIFSGLLPILVADLRKTWSDKVTVSDASPDGYGICEGAFSTEEVGKAGRWQERWRYKRSPIEEWAPRRRALGLDVLHDVGTARRDPFAGEETDIYTRNESFEEVSSSFLNPRDYEVVLKGRWNHTQEHITLKEGRSLVLAVRRIARNASNQGKKHLILIDNLALAFCLGKGRASDFSMLRIAQKIGAVILAANLCLRVRWIPSEVNVADGPSRGACSPGYFAEDGGGLRSCSKQWQREESRGSDDPVPSGAGGLRWEAEQSQPQWDRGFGEEAECSNAPQRGGRYDLGGGAPGKEGKERRDNRFGGQEHQRGATEPVQLLPAEVQGLLQGEQTALANQSKGGRDTRRLLRRPLSRGEGRQLRGEDVGCCGVLFARPEGQNGSEQAGSSRMAQACTAAEPASAAQDGGLRGCHEASFSRRAGGCVVGPVEFRHVPQAWRSSGSPEEEFSATGSWGRNSVSPLHSGGQGGGRRTAGQDGGVQQFYQVGQPEYGEVARGGGAKPCQGKEADGRHLQHQSIAVQGGVQVSREMARLARSLHIPTKAWRCLRRSCRQSERLPGGERPGAMDDGLIGEALRQGGQATESAKSHASVGPRVLPPVPAKDAGGDARTFSAHQPLNPLWQEWREAPPGSILEIFAGEGRLSKAFREKGIQCFPIDVKLHPGDEVLSDRVEQDIVRLLKLRHVSLVWLGMPSNTFSAARCPDGVGPGPLRSDDFPMGLPSLGRREQKSINHGNKLLLFTCRIMWYCYLLNIPFVLEQPWSSMVWATPVLKKFRRLPHTTLTQLHCCQFHELWRKPMGLFASHLDVTCVARICRGSFLCCSRTGKRHIALRGRAADGRFMTLVAQPYPFQLCRELVIGILSQLKSA